MKTKKFLMLLAAVLLSCASAFAQSGNNESLKGDVNGDGTVDVADLTAIIKIMKDAGGAVGEKMYYWYAGTKQVEASNFTDIASRIPESEIPQTGSVSATGQFVYFVLPETKRLASLVGANGSPIKYDYTDAFGYRIYKTLNTINETVYYTVEQITYYWYAGQTQPTTISYDPIVDDTNFTNDKWHTIGTTLTNIGKLVTGGVAGNTWYVAVPKGKYQPTASDLSTPDTSWTIIGTVKVNNIDYSVYDTGNDLNRCATYLKVK
jgi:hypothetical protein